MGGDKYRNSIVGGLVDQVPELAARDRINATGGFIQKEQLESIDYQLFSMLGEHAASALFSSTLYGHSERKRQTYQGFVDLLLK